MLDLELVEPPTDAATDIVSIAEMKRHLRISPSNTSHDLQIADILAEVVDKLDGRGGELNRSLRPCTWRRYLPKFPRYPWKTIQLPYPPLLEVLDVTYESGDSPTSILSGADYIVRKAGGDGVVGEIELLSGRSWPTFPDHPRGVAITYRAGYEAYPPKLKRMVKILAAHYFENPEATINEPRMMMINRVTSFGMEDLRAALRVPVAYDDWE
jgi:uncharacterized phiE125 gp8 family phage protein